MTITTTVTFDDLIHAYDDELEELEDAHAEVVALAREEYGDDALDRHLPRDGDLPDDLEELAVLQQQAQLYNLSIEEIQKRQHALERLADEYDDQAWQIRMLRGDEMLEIGQQLNIERKKDGIDDQMAGAIRQGLVVDAAVVSAPDTCPTDDDGDPEPSRCENALKIALYEQVENLNQAGDTDFRAPGSTRPDTSLPLEPSATPSDSGVPSTDSPDDASD